MNVTTQREAGRGFTLVEMSIVLVIIGLIIGGILKGQEVIASARQKALINQVNAIRSATNTYFDRYRALPGDDPSANTVLDGNVQAGNGDGVVGNAVNTTGNMYSFSTGNTGENYEFFNGLVAADLLNGGQVTSANTASAFGISALPTAPITGAGMVVLYGTHNGDGNNPGTVLASHWVRLQKGVGAPTGAVSPRTVQNIDAATDDGLPDSGGVRGDDKSCDTQGVASPYTISDNQTCLPFFQISQ